ncbi:MAG: sn-glycerol-3-phosphate ABC transporter ATP-binding protein UgpC [Pseudorhodobacter sp.]|nr:sn-glycerol-3-phosphate ABC transporter ATP-binding protein UgpC [Pseudorhodobacter sp.]
MAQLELDGVTKRFGTYEVIRNLTLSIADGEFVVFVGPSGCGKSTALRLICGLEQVSEGDVRIDGVSVSRLEPSRRGVAMVFQSYALYPHMTVAENMGFSLRMEGVPKAERAVKVREAAVLLRLDALLERRPKDLSGGQRQRVAIGRAIVRKPKVFLFDEPLSNLDAELRVQMRFELARLHRELGATIVFVTHDQVEAMTLADRIVVMRDGRVEQVGAPMDVYRDPDNTFVAGFIGSPRINLLDGRVEAVEAGFATVGVNGLTGGAVQVALRADVQIGTAVKLGIRPEHMLVDGPGEGAIAARIEFVEQLGGASFAYAPGFPAGALVSAADPVRGVRALETHNLHFRGADCLLFGSDGARLR